ncbi:MAG: hypothetical protein HYY83_02260 [Deltaproteobacteria bacterium]|nr:hypothetical protein [Deltaproteobacteria bacterium]
MVEVGGKLYVVGGFGQGGDLVEEYDPDKDGWRRRASATSPASGPWTRSMSIVPLQTNGAPGPPCRR